MTNAELIEYLERRLIVARINTFDGGQTIAWYHSSTGSVRITSEWGDPSLAELVERRFPFLFPEDDPTVEFIPTIIEGV